MPLYRPDPNDDKKQVPVVNNRMLLDKVTLPAHSVVHSRPNEVVVNVDGTYAFLYQTTSSIGGDVSGQIGNFISGSVLADAAGGPLTLQIRPVAWRQTNAAGDVGDITFVYKGKYNQNGGPK